MGGKQLEPSGGMQVGISRVVLWRREELTQHGGRAAQLKYQRIETFLRILRTPCVYWHYTWQTYSLLGHVWQKNQVNNGDRTLSEHTSSINNFKEHGITKPIPCTITYSVWSSFPNNSEFTFYISYGLTIPGEREIF